MTLVIPLGYAQASVEMRSDYDPDSWFTTFGIDVSDVGGDFEYAALNAVSAFESGWQGLLSNEVTITGVNLSIGQDGGPPLVIRVNRNNRGVSSGDKLPQNCAALIRKQTGRAGRAGKGRMFLPGILAENKVSQTGIIAGDQLESIQVQATVFRLSLEDGLEGQPGTPMVLLHSFGVPGGTNPDPVLTLVPDATISTQRRRLR